IEQDRHHAGATESELVELAGVVRGVGNTEGGSRRKPAELTATGAQVDREPGFPTVEEGRGCDVVVVDDQRLGTRADEIGDRRSDRRVVAQPGRLALAAT